MAKYTKQKNGLYRTSVQVGYSDDGKPIKKYFSGKTIAELDKKVQQIKHDIAEGMDVLNKGVTFEAYADRWLETYKNNVSVRTKEMYAAILNRHTGELKGKKMADIKRTHIQSQINACSEHPRTCEQIRLTLRQVFEAAVRDNIIRKSPVEGIKLPRHIPEEKRALTDQEKKAIKAALFNERETAFIYLLYGTGMRPGEAYALTWRDIDFTKNEVTVNKSITFAQDRQPKLVPPKTNSGIRTIPLPTMAVNALQRYKRTSTSLIVFNGFKGGYMTKYQTVTLWEHCRKKIEEQLGAECDITPYYFRHNYCTELYYSGISIIEAKRLMGHADHEMIMRVYSHLDASRERTAEKINRIAF